MLGELKQLALASGKWAHRTGELHQLQIVNYDDGSTEYRLFRLNANLNDWVNLLWFRLAADGRCLVRFQL